jgi:hypothetical protein
MQCGAPSAELVRQTEKITFFIDRQIASHCSKVGRCREVAPKRPAGRVNQSLLVVHELT